MSEKFCKECGRDKSHVIIKTTPETLATYLEFKQSEFGLCMWCWLEKHNSN